MVVTGGVYTSNYLLSIGGEYNFNLRGVLEMAQWMPGGHDYVPPMIGATSKSKMEHWFLMVSYARNAIPCNSILLIKT